MSNEQGWMASLGTAGGLLRAYASILFAEKPWVGGLFLLATFWFPNAGLSGLLAALVAMLTARLLHFINLESGLHVYNSLLVGLSLGAYYQLDIYLAVLIVLGAVLAVFMTVAIASLFWRLERLPALSLPFVLVALTTTLAAHSYGTLSRYLLPLSPHETLLHPWADQFLTALGSAFFTPHPIAGLMMFFGLLITSRYLALLAMAGFASGYATYAFLSGSPHPDLVAWNGFNFILVAIALGGIFTVPGRQSFILAMIGAVLAALVTAATETFMLVYGLPVMALPFLLTTLILLVALQKRPASQGLQLLLEAPALPEKSYEQARLARVRSGEFGSVAVLPPFFGRWMIYQGFDGKHTHQPPWQHALDYYITEGEKSYRTDGLSAVDYYCFGLPVIAPVEGYVVKSEGGLPDNSPGKVDMENNWGNHLLIRMHNGLYLLLAHLKQGSVEVQHGDFIRVGQPLALCGSSGRSPQPHLHMHVQLGEALGSATHPFHMTTILLQHKGETRHRFYLYARPVEADSVTSPKTDLALAASMQMTVGRQFHYQVINNGEEMESTLTVTLTLAGHLRLSSDSGASAALEYRENLMALHDRQGKADPLLDAWLLALGLTPFCEGEPAWHDQAAENLFPMSKAQFFQIRFFRPLGGGMRSDYSRLWTGQCWMQTANHCLSSPLGASWSASTEATIQPHLGCTGLKLTSDSVKLEARLLEITQHADAGIPQWKMNIESEEQGKEE